MHDLRHDLYEVADAVIEAVCSAGGLVFSGASNDRYFRAFDAKNGEMLWEFRTNSGVTRVPSTYAVDGVQYIAVQSGWGIDAQRMQGRLDTFYGTTTWLPQGGALGLRSQRIGRASPSLPPYARCAQYLGAS
jgi:outer membrane protein assembly factor BamB